MNIGKQFLEEFIEVYKNQVALWQVKNERYRNKNERQRSLNILLRKTKEYEKDATIESVKRKINSLRTSYRRELQKIRKSEKFEENYYGEYVPTLWYFGLLDFLRDQGFQAEDGSISAVNDPLEFEKEENIEKPTPDQKPNLTDEDSMPLENPTPRAKRQKVIDEDFEQIEKEKPTLQAKKQKVIDEDFEQIDKEKSPTPTSTTKRKITEEEFLEIAAEHLENAKKQAARDEADIFSEGWAMMYRKLNGEQKIYAKRIIDETLMHGQFDQLSYSSSLNFLHEKD